MYYHWKKAKNYTVHFHIQGLLASLQKKINIRFLYVILLYSFEAFKEDNAKYDFNNKQTQFNLTKAL